MATLTDADIADLTTGTLKHLGRMKFNQVATTVQRHVGFTQIMKKDRVQFDSGVGIQRQIMIDHSSAAKAVGLFETDKVAVGDVMDTIDVPWRHYTTSWAFERRELAMNRPSPQRIYNLIKVRRADGMISLAELIEEHFWDKPVDSTDKLQMFGIKYWVVSGGGSTGFVGGDPSGFSAGAGNLAVATAPRWKNYGDRYVGVTVGDAITKMRVAYRKIHFINPIDIEDYRRGATRDCRIYVNNDTLIGFEDIGSGQNESLGTDLATVDGQMTFRGAPISYVPQLDGDSTDPIYMLNFQWLAPVFLAGEYLRESEPKISGNQHTVFEVFVDTTMQMLVTNRRAQAIIDKA